jgi:uncharacterized membrane protein (DUF485 family)
VPAVRSDRGVDSPTGPSGERRRQQDRADRQDPRHDPTAPEVAPVSKEAPERVVDDPNVTMQNSPEFAQLRSKFRKFVFPLTALFLAWYFLFVLLSVFAKDFMGTRVLGNITWGLILGLLQFVSTFTITMVYARWADRVFDPEAEALAQKMGVKQ